MTRNSIQSKSLPGGTLTLTTNALVNRYENPIKDKYEMGRWSGMTYRIGNNRKLNVITAYRVIDQKITTTNSMSTNSQQHFMLKDRNVNNKPRRSLLLTFVNNLSQCVTMRMSIQFLWLMQMNVLTMQKKMEYVK
jgi:hypothetical protein